MERRTNGQMVYLCYQTDISPFLANTLILMMPPRTCFAEQLPILQKEVAIKRERVVLRKHVMAVAHQAHQHIQLKTIRDIGDPNRTQVSPSFLTPMNPWPLSPIIDISSM